MGLMDFLKGPQGVSNPPSIATRPAEPDPAPTPLTYAFTQRREPDHQGPTFLMAPDDNSYKLYDLNIPWQDAPDPIRQSGFWDAGNKIHPAAQMGVASNLAIGSREAVMQDTFQIGKLLGYIHRPMYAGQQNPSVIRANIQEALPTTYGSQYEVQGVEPAGPVTATGFTAVSHSDIITPQGSLDGYPY